VNQTKESFDEEQWRTPIVMITKSDYADRRDNEEKDQNGAIRGKNGDS
jgi:hypothetical protein